MKMKIITGVLLLIILSQVSSAQFYYKDIVLTKQAADKWKSYKDNNVKSVKLLSFEPNNQPTDGFTCEQTCNRDFSEISTHTQSSLTSESFLTAYYDSKGMLKKTIDTSDRFQSTTLYQYDEQGRVVSILNTSVQADNQSKDVELHQWRYDEHGNPAGMLKIKNNSDTTFIRFVTDEKGNVVEEHATRNKLSMPVIFYYYDDNRRLTDIVRYNAKAQRLLPDLVFEYDDHGYLHSMLTVPEDSNGYQKWMYDYNDKGLRSREACYSKQRELLGKIEYQYFFR
jgi:YD repeat-containing protein